MLNLATEDRAALAEQLVTTDRFEEWFATHQLRVMRSMDEEHVTERRPELHLHVLPKREGDPDLVACAIVGEWNEKRFQVMTTAGHEIARLGHGVLAAFIAVEVWVGQNPDVAPGQDPDRREAIALCGRTIDGRCATAVFPVRRTLGNRMILDAPDTLRSWLPGEDTSSGLLDHFFHGYSLERVAGRIPVAAA